jgi:predicted  nucleic acid-binding Zn-ribbon protein
MRPRTILAGVAFVALVAGTTGKPAAQAPPAGPPSDALLAEVRALRAELNQAAGTSIRTQLLVARLQLQEQRINTVAKQLDEARTMLGTLPAGLPGMQAQLKQLENESRDPAITAERRQALDATLEMAKSQIADLQRQIGALTEKESTLAATLSSEQGRWFDFNTRLDEIERELSQKAAFR